MLETSGRGTFSQGAPWHPLLMISTGVVTAVPLLLFAAGTARVPLTTTGLLQYITPVIQLVIGVAVLGEAMPASRWIGFALVWLALVVLTVDMLRAARRRRAVVPAVDGGATGAVDGQAEVGRVEVGGGPDGTGKPTSRGRDVGGRQAQRLVEGFAEVVDRHGQPVHGQGRPVPVAGEHRPARAPGVPQHAQIGEGQPCGPLTVAPLLGAAGGVDGA